MMLSRGRLARTGLILLALLVAGLAALHLRYPLPYVYRVLVYQNPDFEDIHRFPANEIGASLSPRELPPADDPSRGERIVELFELHPEIDDFDAFLEVTETTALLVVHQGEIVVERYLRGYDAGTPQNTFSVSKSVTSALVGLAVRDGLLALDDPITRHLPELAERDERFSRITVGHLLDMRSGIRYDDEVPPPFFTADDPLIYYHPDLESVALERTEIAAPPGEFQYNNYNPPLLGLILRRVTGIPVGDYLERELWHPSGAASPAGWTADDHGIERMESGFHATARDQARLGLLYLETGELSGRAILPPTWITDTTTTPERIEVETHDGRSWAYRYGWWLVPHPEGAPDFTGIGRNGQFLYVSPQAELVIVRNGPGRGGWGDRSWTGLFFEAARALAGLGHLPPGAG